MRSIQQNRARRHAHKNKVHIYIRTTKIWINVQHMNTIKTNFDQRSTTEHDQQNFCYNDHPMNRRSPKIWKETNWNRSRSSIVTFLWDKNIHGKWIYLTKSKFSSFILLYTSTDTSSKMKVSFSNPTPVEKMKSFPFKKRNGRMMRIKWRWKLPIQQEVLLLVYKWENSQVKNYRNLESRYYY